MELHDVPYVSLSRMRFTPPISMPAMASFTFCVMVLRMDVLLERSSVSPKFEAT